MKATLKLLNVADTEIELKDGKAYMDGQLVYTVKEGETELKLIQDIERIFGPLQVIPLSCNNEHITEKKEEA